MKLKRFLTSIVALAMGMIIYSMTANAATNTSSDHSSYYQATKTFKINLYGSNQKITIPKGTIVSALLTDVNDSTGNVYQAGQLYLLNINYRVRRNWPRAHAGGLASLSALSKVELPLKSVATPKYMPKTVQGGDVSGVVITRKPSQIWERDAWITITTDGYVSHFKARKKFDTRTQPKPDSSVKITKTKRSGATLYLYYRRHVKGVPDKRVAKTGTAQYRLKIVTKKKLVSRGDGTMRSDYLNFKIGGKNYYVVQ